LAIELLRARKMLAKCERPECGRYFVKEFSRDRYCKTRVRPSCGEDMRERSVKKYQETHRKELNARRRKYVSSRSKSKRQRR
jgi:hypothetical protein